MNSTNIIFDRTTRYKMYDAGSKKNGIFLHLKSYFLHPDMNNFKKYALLIFGFIFLFGAFLIGLREMQKANPVRQWEVQSIDTMKYSRDLGHDRLQDPTFVRQVDNQVAAIAKTGATHVAIATPYDDEFLPMSKLWVRAARRNHLKVWFRGNWSGWEGWYNYARIGPEEHKTRTRDFILANKSLFEDGDIFSSCPECENGPRVNIQVEREVNQHREFLIQEYQIAKQAFSEIGKDVDANYYSMNYDLAKVMMDPETTQAFDGIVVVDHYVADPHDLAKDMEEMADRSGGTVVLGEFGAPIPDINGQMTPDDQKQWLETALEDLVKVKQLKGVNYWVNTGGTTAIWEENGNARPAVGIISNVFKGK
jgi:hypothetical protein